MNEKTLTDKEQTRLEVVKRREARWKVLWRLLAFSRPEAVKIALGLVGLSINAVTNLSFPWLIGKALDQSSMEDLSAFLLRNAYFFLAGTFASWLRIYCLGSAAENIASRLRTEIFVSFLAQDISYYESLEMGDVVTLLEKDVQLSADLLTEKVANLLRSLNSAINGSISLYSISPELCSITLAIVPVVGIAAMTLSRYSRSLANKLREQQSKILSYGLERIRCISTVRLNHREQYEQKQFSHLIEGSNSISESSFHVQGTFMSFVNLFTNMSLIAILRAGGRLVNAGQLTVGSLTSFALQSAFVGLGFSGLSTFYSDTMKALDAASRIFTVLDQRQIAASSPSNSSSTALTATTVNIDANAGIKLENVSFTYSSRPDSVILCDINLTLSSTGITAIVGRSGSGKSTLVALLSGLQQPTNGTITYFGAVTVSNYQGKEQQEQIFGLCGVVEQSGNNLLLTGTIRDNIAYGKENASEVEIEHAAKMAHAHDFIVQFPSGYDTDIGVSGCLLSGGQQARIALARALIKQPKYLVLDETTAALDAESEAAVLQPLQVLKTNTAIIFFTHSEAVKSMADNIYELQEGRIVKAVSQHQNANGTTGKS